MATKKPKTSNLSSESMNNAGVSFLEKYREKIIELSAQGQSAEEIFVNLVNEGGGFQGSTYGEISGNYDEFMGMCKEYESLSLAWWVAQGRICLKGDGKMGFGDGGKLNFNVWYANMKNRFGWKDTQEIEQKLTVEFSDKEQNELRALRGELRNLN